MHNSGGSDDPIGGSGIIVSGNFTNQATGVIEAKGGKGLGAQSCSHPGIGGIGLKISGLTDNYGTLKAYGGEPEYSIGTSGGTSKGGVGMEFSGLVTNYARIEAYGGNTNAGAGSLQGGTGAMFLDGLINHDIVTAKGGNAKATSAGDATGAAGMSVTGGSYNYDVLVAQGGLKENGGGPSIETAGVGITFNDGLTNYKDSFLTLLGHGGATTDAGAAAVALGGTVGSDPELPHGAYFRLGSYLALGSADVAGQNSGAYIDANGMDVVFEKEASGNIPVSAVISLVASSTSVGSGPVTHTGFVTNTSSTLSSANLASYEGPVMKVTFSENANATTPGNNDFNFTAERVGLSSEKTEGITSEMLATWEKDLLGQPITAANCDWANLLSAVDFQPTFAELTKDAEEIFEQAMGMPLANNQAVQSLARAARYVDGMFSHNMQSLAKCRQAKACGYNENAYDGRTAGLVCGVSTDPLMIWAQPFFYDGRQKGKRAGYHDFDETYYGVTAGIAYDADIAILSAEVHYYQGDLDTRHYKGDVNAMGFELGIGRCFNISDNINPWVEVRAGYTWMEIDQKRTDINGMKATSKPDAGVWTGGITVNNAFSLTEQIKITPHIGVDLVQVDMESYTEKNSTLATKVSPKDYTSVQGTIGVQLDYNPTVNIYLEARAAYHYEFADTKADSVARGVGLSTNLKVPSDDLSRNSATFGAGVGVKLTDNVSVRADYDVHLADRYVGHQVSATLSFTF